MSQQTQTKWDNRNKQVAVPKAQSKRAHRTIDQRRQANVQRYNQATYPQNKQGYPSAPLKKGVPQLQGKNLSHKRKRQISKGSFKKLLILRFVALIVVVTGLTIMGLGLYTLITGLISLIIQPVKEPPPKPSLPQVVYLPSVAPPVRTTTDSLPLPSRQLGRENSAVVYNLTKPPELRQSQELQVIVNDIVNFAAAQGFPTKPLSITLINAKTGEIAGYQQDTLKYPASVVKMFWMVYLYAQMENGIWANVEGFNAYIAKMIQESSNEAASFIVDKISDTEFAPNLNEEELQIWREKREQITQFFQKAGYDHINISHKTYPISSLNLLEPKGSELQIRHSPNRPNQTMSNQITTDHAARLLYETCYLGQAVSLEASKKMCGWLRRDLNPQVWQEITNGFNPISGFLGESLSDTNVHFYSKAGWTSGHRHDAALIATPDGKTIYILTIFADDSMYAKDWKIFPKMSRLVYDYMIFRK